MESSGSSKGCMEQFTSHLRSQRGMLLFAEIIACIVIIICYGASSSFGYTGLAVFILIYCVVLFIIFMLELHLQLTFIHWGWTTFIRALIGAVAFVITAIIVFFSRPDGGAIAGASLQMGFEENHPSFTSRQNTTLDPSPIAFYGICPQETTSPYQFGNTTIFFPWVLRRTDCRLNWQVLSSCLHFMKLFQQRKRRATLESSRKIAKPQ